MSEISNELTIYAFSHVETWLEDYAKSQRLSSHELTERVARLLLAQTSREVLGVDNTVPALRRQATKGNKGTRKVALAKRPYRKAQVKLHWTQRPENQAKVKKQMKGMRKKYNQYLQLVNKAA